MAEVISIQKSVQHNNGDSWELDNYPPFAQTDNAEEWLGVSEISLERAKELAFELGGDEAYDYEDEINNAEDLYELQDALDNLKYYQRDNTYNSSWWGGVVDFGALTEDGEGYKTGLVLLRMHRGGDPRGNYYEMKAFELDSFIEEFPPYFGRLSYYIKTDEGDLTLDADDMEGYSLLVVEDETGTFEQDDYVKIDEVEDAFDMNGNSFFSFGGGVAVGSLIGAYIGYKVGRTRGKQKGGSFATEKKIYGKVKKKFDGGGKIIGFTNDPIFTKGNISVQRVGGSAIWNVAINKKNMGRVLNAYTKEQAFKKVMDEKFAGGGGVRKVNGKKYPFGSAWALEHNKVNKSENYEIPISKRKKYDGGGSVEDEIAYLDNRIYNLKDLRSRGGSEEDMSYYDMQIKDLENEKQELLNPSRKEMPRKKLFGLFGDGGGIDDLIKG